MIGIPVEDLAKDNIKLEGNVCFDRSRLARADIKRYIRILLSLGWTVKFRNKYVPTPEGRTGGFTNFSDHTVTILTIDHQSQEVTALALFHEIRHVLIGVPFVLEQTIWEYRLSLDCGGLVDMKEDTLK